MAPLLMMLSWYRTRPECHSGIAARRGTALFGNRTGPTHLESLMHVISLCGAKGGSLETATSLSLASLLVEQGADVALVDLV